MSVVTRHWELKLLALAFAVAIWLFVMSSEKSDLVLAAPIEWDGVPAGLELSSDRPDTVDVHLHALRGSLSRLAPDQIRARINLSRQTAGEVTLRVLPELVSVPAGITVVRVSPSRIRVVLEASNPPHSQAGFRERQP